MLKNKNINGWRLFWLLSTPISVIVAREMMLTDISTGKGLSHMISYSVRFAIPFIYMVVAASSIQILFPGPITNWWLRNRKYIGLCFAVAMAWQGLFIFIVSTFLRDYYFKEIYFFRDELEGSVGYIFLVAMVITSFHFGRKLINQKQWKLIHKGGVYFLWAYPLSVYWWALSYEEPLFYQYIFYWAGFIAFVMRIAAWGKKRQQKAKKLNPESSPSPIFKVLGGAFIALGICVGSFGMYWQKMITNFLTGPAWSAELELWLPFWPFEPFIAFFILGLGTLLMTKAKEIYD